jgi:hypothetical protein
MSILRVFAFLIAVFSLAPAFAQEPDPSQIDPSQEMLPPPPPETPTYDEQGYVPRSVRARQAPTPVRLPVSAVVPASYFAGRWGQVSFNNADDLPKMAKVARDYCKLPTTITLSSPSTFRMYVATELKEAQVFEQNGSLYIIPTEQLSDGLIRGARELHVLDNNTFTLRYLEDEAHRRYGPNVFARCGAAKAPGLPEGAEKSPAETKKPASKKKRVPLKLREQAKTPTAPPVVQPAAPQPEEKKPE